MNPLFNAPFPTVKTYCLNHNCFACLSWNRSALKYAHFRKKNLKRHRSRSPNMRRWNNIPWHRLQIIDNTVSFWWWRRTIKERFRVVISQEVFSIRNNNYYFFIQFRIILQLLFICNALQVSDMMTNSSQSFRISEVCCAVITAKLSHFSISAVIQSSTSTMAKTGYRSPT